MWKLIISTTQTDNYLQFTPLGNWMYSTFSHIFSSSISPKDGRVYHGFNVFNDISPFFISNFRDKFAPNKLYSSHYRVLIRNKMVSILQTTFWSRFLIPEALLIWTDNGLDYCNVYGARSQRVYRLTHAICKQWSNKRLTNSILSNAVETF